MADQEVTLLLGEQMAIVFLGLNVLLPMTFSALLALLILLVVHTNRFLKRTMGRTNSKEQYDKMDSLVQESPPNTPVHVIDTGETNSAIRKRRSSLVQTAESLSKISDKLSTGKSSRQSSPSPTTTQSCEVRASDGGPTPVRRHRIGSGNRVSPLTPPGDSGEKLALSWAWMDPATQVKAQEKKREYNQKQTGRVVSPSHCDIQTVSPDERVKKDLFFQDEMKAYDIW